MSQFGDLESPRAEQNFPPSITDVIRPMEMAELVDILPSLGLSEEETPSGPSMPAVMHMLESFALGIGENSPFFDLEGSDLIVGAKCLLEPDCDGLTDTDTQQVSSLPARSQVEWDRPSTSS